MLFSFCSSHVVPLSLLSFRACSQAFSIDRQPAWDIESKWRDLVSKKSDIGCSGCELRRNVSDQTNCSNNSHNHSYTAEQMRWVFYDHQIVFC